MTNKDYGFNISISSVIHSDGLFDIGVKVSDSNGLEYDEMLESIDPSNMGAIYDLILNKCGKAMLESKGKEKPIDRTVSDKFLAELKKKNQDIEDLYNRIDELSDRLKSYEIDNQILRMRNDDLVNEKVKNVNEKLPVKEKLNNELKTHKNNKYSNKVSYRDNYSSKYLPPWFGPYFLG